MAIQRFDEKMAAHTEAESKQLKVLAKKTKAMAEYAEVLIDEADKHAKKTSERAKAVTVEREEQS